MALFGKKKGEATGRPLTSTSVSANDNGAFDFDAIARDLDAQGGASSFDSLLAHPAEQNSSSDDALSDDALSLPPGTNTSAFDDSVFDFDLEPVQSTPSTAHFDDPFDVPPPPAPIVAAKPAAPVQAQAPEPVVAPVAPIVSSSTPPVEPVTPMPQTVVNAPMDPFDAPSTETVIPMEVTAPLEPPVASENTPEGWVNVALPRKKSLPLVPALGALGLLAVVGGGAMFFLNSQKEATDDASTPAITRPNKPSGAPAAKPSAAPPRVALAPVSSAKPKPSAPKPVATAAAAPTKPATPATSAPAKAPSPTKAPVATTAPVVTTAPRSASPGIAPQPAAKPVVVSSRAPSATANLPLPVASRLKALWKAGADAKHRGDYKSARAAWQEALHVRPGHPGFQDAINKLPK